MGEKKRAGTCGGCRFGRDFGDGLRCIKDPPSVNQETGEAVWPCVRITDTCREFRPAGDGRDLVVDRRLRGMIPIYRDKEGDYCKIPLTRGHYAKVDPEDYCWLSQFRWHYVRTGRTFYAVRSDYSGGRGRKIWMHREIMGTAKGLVCDHVNHNGQDNRKHNLRNCTVAQNNLNRQRYRNSRSRYKGVWWCKCMQMYGSEIQAFGATECLGYFVHEVEAARAYDAAARRLHGEFACLNFPGETPGRQDRPGNSKPETNSKHK